MPNHIPRAERISNVLFSVPLLAYSIYGFVHDDIYIPGRRGPGVHMYGVPMWLMCAAMLSVGASLLSVVIDHYDTRANEANYRKFAAVTQLLGWVLFFGAFALDIWVYRGGGR